MKKKFHGLLFLFGVLIFFYPQVGHSQTIYEGQVLDKKTQAAIQFVTVALSKAKKATRTNDQGYFYLASTSSVDNDDLIFTCIGYQTYRLPISAYKRGMFIVMRSSSTELKEVVVRHRKKTQKLEEFSQDNLDSQMSWAFIYPFYSAQMYAKLFETTKSDAVVSSVDLGRWQPNPDSWEIQPGKISKFKVHIMTVNTASGAPDSILATQEISLQDRSRKVTIRFDSTNVVLPGKSFFVAIEWLPAPYNEYILKSDFVNTQYNKKGTKDTWQNGGFDRVIYQPILVNFNCSSNQRSWKLINGSWLIYKHPGSEIALSATINY